MAETECQECGERNPERARFCLRCGAQLVLTTASAETTPPVRPSAPLPWSTADRGPVDAASPARLEIVPPPTELSVAGRADQWDCLVCGTANGPARALCSYCGNNRGATTDETGVFPASLALQPAAEPAPVETAPVEPAAALVAETPRLRPSLRDRLADRGHAVDLGWTQRHWLPIVLGLAVVVVAWQIGIRVLGPGQAGGNQPADRAPDRLVAVGELRVDGRLRSANGQYLLTLGADGNLVVADIYGNRRWESRTPGAVKLVMQDDGNLVLYRADGEPAWATDTNGPTDAYWVMLQDDGNLVLHPPGGDAVLWSSRGDTGCTGGAWCGPCLWHCP